MQVDTLVLRLSVQALMLFLSQVYQHLLFTSLEMEPLLNYEMPPIFGEKIAVETEKTLKEIHGKAFQVAFHRTGW